ncbi:MAG: hypothetical protein NC132_03125 [Corallococcus sp.]|nr:hypothetical protein [Corallococcus sp.]MCM1359099.1 hypothetical protein [Corallococcus sp.]MCM1395088.1 hypothetical protein [Corallococcus sp.]
MIFRIIKRYIILPLLVVGLLCAVCAAIAYTKTAEAATDVYDVNSDSKVIHRPTYTYYWCDENEPQFTVHFAYNSINAVEELTDLPVSLTTNGTNNTESATDCFVDFLNAKRPAPQKDGYIFVGWYVGNHIAHNPKCRSIDFYLSDICSRTDDLTLHPHYEPEVCTVTYHWTSNGITQERTVKVNHGEPAPEFIPNTDGLFLGWLRTDIKDHYDGTPITKNLVLKAEVKTCTICYELTDIDGSVKVVEATEIYGLIPTLYAPDNASDPAVLHYDWYVDAECTQQYVPEPLTNDVTLYGKAVTRYDLFTEFVPVLHNESTGTHSAGNFSFQNDVAVMKDDPSTLVFRLKLNNPNNAAFSVTKNTQYTFNVIRQSNDGAQKIVYRFLADYNAGNRGWGFYQYSDCVKGETVQMYTTIDEAEYNGWKYTAAGDYPSKLPITLPWSIDMEPWNEYILYLSSSIKTTYLPFIHEEADGSKYVYLTVDAANTTDRYTVIFDQGGTKINSYSASVYDVVNSLSDRGTLEDNFGDNKDDANNVLESTTKTIVVKYLQDIPNTHFATAVKKTVDVVVDGSGEVKTSAVAAALGVKNFDALGSTCIGFEFDASEQTYVAKYLKNVWLSAKTVDGKSANYFLDCNLSFQEYYGKLVKDKVFTQDLYDYVYAQILNTAPYYLAGYKPNELYGYWGYVVIPNTYTLDALWAELFDTKTSFDGVITKYEYTELLSISAYDKLLSEYDYSWIGHAWNDTAAFLTGSASANHYIFYAEAETNKTEIGENGGGNGGAMENGIKDAPNKILNWLEKGFSWWDNRSKTTKTIVYVILGVIVAAFISCIIANIVVRKRQ